MSSNDKKAKVEANNAKRGRHGVSSLDNFSTSDSGSAKKVSRTGKHGIGKKKDQIFSASFANRQPADTPKVNRQPAGTPFANRQPSGASNSAKIPSNPVMPSIPNKKKNRAKKIAIIVISVILALVLALSAAGAVYIGMLNSTLSLDESSKSAVDEVTTPANFNEPFYLLVLGSDSREGSGTSSKPDESGDNERSDAIMLFRIDASSKLVTMVSIPRDTPYTHANGSVTKINETYNIGGAAYTIQAVSEITNVPISYYAEVHFSELAAIVDTLGGVEVNVDIQLSYIDALTGEKVTIEPGVQTLNGQEAQIFARARKEYSSDQDMHRQENIRQLASSIIKSVLNRPLVELPGTILDLAGYVGTNLKTQDIISIGMIFNSSNDTMKMYTCTGPSDGNIRTDVGDIWLCYDNPEGWQILMDAVDKGEDPSDLDLNQYAIK